MARITPESIKIETLGSSILPTFLGGSYGEPLDGGPSGEDYLGNSRGMLTPRGPSREWDHRG